jgi:stage V sporulation protein G
MKIERMNKGEWGKLRAFFDLRTKEGIVVKGFKLVEGINGMFVGMPSQKGKDDEFFDTVFMDRDLRDELNQVAMDAYNNPNFGSDMQQQSETQEQTKEPTTEKMPEELSSTENMDTVQPFDDNDIPF